MFQPDLTRDEAILYGYSKVEPISTRRERQDSSLNNLPDLETLIPNDLSPNKRAIIETLAALWQSQPTSHSGYTS